MLYHMQYVYVTRDGLR